MSPNLEIDRRGFLKLAALGLGSLFLTLFLPGCNGRKPDFTPTSESDINTLSGKLRYVLGITPQTTQEELILIAAEKQFGDDTWIYAPLPNGQSWIIPENKKYYFAGFQNTRQEEVRIGLDDRDELALFLPKEPNLSVEYPLPEQPIYWKGAGIGGNHLLIYGPKDTVTGLYEQYYGSEDIRNFLKEYFGQEDPTDSGRYILRAIHLIFAPPNYGPFPLQGMEEPFDPAEIFSAKTTVGTSTEGNIRHTIVNLPLIHRDAARMGIPLDLELLSVLANERASLRGFEGNPGSTSDTPLTEAWSSLCGLSSLVDPSMRPTLMGGTSYGAFINPLAQIMEKLATVTV